MTRQHLGLLGLLGALVLSGCGGGGGGGDPAPQGQPPPSVSPTPLPPLPALALTEGNTVAATALVMRQAEYVHVAAGDVIFVANVLTFRGVSQFTVSCDGAVVAQLSNTDPDQSGNITTGDSLRLQHSTCHGLARETTMLVTAADYAAGRLEGQVTFSVATDGGTRSDGSFALVSSFDATTLDHTLSMSNIDIGVASAGTTAEIRNAQSERFIDARANYRISVSGQATDSTLGGEFTFATVTPFTGSFGGVPTAGELELVGGVSTARITPADAVTRPDQFEFRIEAAGTGSYTAAQSTPWSAVVDGYIFCWDSNTRPEITSLSVTPSSPTVRDQLAASFTATDPDGDPLTYVYEWRVGGNLLSVGPSTTLPLTQLRKGDVVTFVLRVTDSRAGTTVASTSTTIANTPPENVTVRLEPTVARTTDDVTLFYGSTDIDGEPSQASFEWRRNGVPIPGQTGQFLPHTEHAKGDVITGIAHLSDGEAVTSASASITIADTPPVVALPDTIDDVPYGETLTIDVTASDIDGDPTGSFVLTHGPAGMSIDPATGRVSWPHRGPAFEPSVSMNFGVTIDRPGANVVTSAVGLYVPNRADPLLRTGLDAPLTSALKAGDFDDDGDEEILVLGQDALYELEWTGTGYRQSWVYPFPLSEGQRPAALATADIDGDGRHEIFVGDGATILKLDGATRRYETGAGFGFPQQIFRDIEIGDIDGDGRLELIAIASHLRSGDPAASGTLMLFRPETMSYVWSFGVNEGSAIAIGNVDTDAPLEIVTNSGYVVDGLTWLNEWRYTPAFGWEVDTGDLDGDGIEEIVASVDNGPVRAYSAVSRTALWTIPNPDTDAIVVTNIAGDADDEVLIGDGPGGSGLVRIYAQTAPGTATLLSGVGALGDDLPAIATGDVDDDGQLELIFGSALPSSSIAVAGGTPLAIEWTTADLDPQILLGPYVGGELARNASGPSALLFAAVRTVGGGMRLLGMDPDTGDITASADFGEPGNGFVALTVADYDADGTDEALIASSSDAMAYHRAYDFFGATQEWNTVFTSTQNGIAVAYGDLTGDGREDFAAIDNEGIVRVYDVYNGTLLWTGPTLLDGRDVAIAELNGGGSPEIVVAAAERIFVYSRDGQATYVQTRMTAALLPALRDISVGDVDGDGALEVFALYGLLASVQRFDAALVAQGGFDYWREARGIMIEPSSYARKNLLLVESLDDDQLVVVDPTSGEEIWQSPALLGSVARDGVHFVDIAGDGELRISVATSRGMYLTR